MGKILIDKISKRKLWRIYLLLLFVDIGLFVTFAVRYG